MDDNDKVYNKYLKYKEKYLFLQQIAAGYKKYKDFTQKISKQEAKVANITSSIASTKEELKTAVNAEIAALEAYHKDVADKNNLKQLNSAKSISQRLKKKLESAESTLGSAKYEYHNLVIRQRDSKEKIAENNVNFAKSIVIAKKKIIKKIQKKIEKLNENLKNAEASLTVAQSKEAEAATKLDEMKNALVQVENEELNRLGGIVNNQSSVGNNQPAAV
jgi:chromosome segregation ATPase